MSNFEQKGKEATTKLLNNIEQRYPDLARQFAYTKGVIDAIEMIVELLGET